MSAGLGALLLLGSLGSAELARSGDTVGEVPDVARETPPPSSAAELPEAPRASAPTAPPSPADEPGADELGADEPGADDAVAAETPPAADGPATTAASGAADDPEEAPAPVADPARLRIDAIGVDHRVVPVGLEPDGAMELPADVREVGWFSPRARPGERGSAVLAGHVDSRSQGRGALFDLRTLAVDDRIEVETVDGERLDWRVVGRTTYDKGELPVDELFARGGDPRLVLITCGGAYDPATRSYAENVVVIAEPA
ncbi:sortase domain-bontaining protein [Egicoccus sp. AB-alg2]|uniref:class F sortase n=1 Tax=Egicoccus sp. AB-alg2 TaxID=3242693 RepID=UPI00359DEB9F